jgi:hypothetical protein
MIGIPLYMTHSHIYTIHPACAACRVVATRTASPITNTTFFKMIDRGRWQRTIFEFRIDSNLNLVAVSREPAPASEGPGLRMGLFPCGAPPSLRVAFRV